MEDKAELREDGPMMATRSSFPVKVSLARTRPGLRSMKILFDSLHSSNRDSRESVISLPLILTFVDCS